MITIFLITISYPIILILTYTLITDLHVSSRIRTNKIEVSINRFKYTIKSNVILPIISLVYYVGIPILLIVLNYQINSNIDITFLLSKTIIIVVFCIIINKHKLSNLLFNVNIAIKYYKKGINKNKKYGEYREDLYPVDKIKYFQFHKIFLNSITIIIIGIIIEYFIVLLI